jgi:hypothetical protein
MAAKKKTTKPTKAQARTYYPPKTFDDDLVALVDLYTSSNWSFSNVDLSVLKADSKAQRTQRQAYDAAVATFEQAHASFGSAQEARYQRFSAALNAARGAFRNDKVVTAQLAKFKRSAERSAKKTAAPKAPGT